jgi:hypothetical protein
MGNLLQQAQEYDLRYLFEPKNRIDFFCLLACSNLPHQIEQEIQF